jgi:PII-like signaling protein
VGVDEPAAGAGATVPVNDDCLKLTTYLGERDRVDGRFVADELVGLYAHHRLRTSVVLRGAEGFGLKHWLRTDRLLSLSEDLPIVSVAVDSRPRIEALLPAVTALKRRGLVTLERARMLSGELPAMRLSEELDEATKLTVYLGRQERAYGAPAYAAVCDLLHRRGVAGATALLGVDGTANGIRRRARFFAANSEVPMMLIAVADGAGISRVLPQLGGLLRDPIVTLERVRICKRDGQLLAEPHALPGTDERGLALWQKLMVYTSEQASHDGRPLHVELVRRLRRHTASGATVLRGLWGFHGDHAPHGDKLLQIRRHVPVVTVLVDTPERIAESFAVIDALTTERGLVTSEMVPALTAITPERRHGGLRLARHRF